MISFDNRKLVIEARVEIQDPCLYKYPVLLIPKVNPILPNQRYFCWLGRSKKNRPKVLLYGPLSPDPDKPPPPTLLYHMDASPQGHIVLRSNEYIFVRENYRVMIERPQWFLMKAIEKKDPDLAMLFVSRAVTAVLHGYLQDILTEDDVATFQRELERLEGIASRTGSPHKGERDNSFRFLSRLGERLITEIKRRLNEQG